MAENPEGGAAQESGGYDYKRLHSYPLIRVSRWNVSCNKRSSISIHVHGIKSHCFSLIFKFQYSDMNDEMRTEAMELCVTACEKFSTNNEVCIIIHKIVCAVRRLTLSELKITQAI